MSLEHLQKTDPDVYELVRAEERYQARRAEVGLDPDRKRLVAEATLRIMHSVDF